MLLWLPPAKFPRAPLHAQLLAASERHQLLGALWQATMLDSDAEMDFVALAATAGEDLMRPRGVLAGHSEAD